MNRLGLTHPSTLTGKHNAEYSALYQAFSDHANANLSGASITYQLPSTGALVGPFGILLHTPHIGRAFLDLWLSVHELPGLTPRHREIIALVVAAHERSAFQLYSHSRLAEISAVTENEVRALEAGLFADSFTEEDQVIYRLAREMCVQSGSLSSRVWDETVARFGKVGAATAVHCAALHRYEASILRGFNAQVPAPPERVESQKGST